MKWWAEERSYRNKLCFQKMQRHNFRPFMNARCQQVKWPKTTSVFLKRIALLYSHCLDVNLNDQKTSHFFWCIPGMLGTYTIPKIFIHGLKSAISAIFQKGWYGTFDFHSWVKKCHFGNFSERLIWHFWTNAWKSKKFWVKCIHLKW